MHSSRIEEKIEDIYGFVESCKMQHLSTTKVIVPKNELYDLLDDLRRDVPEEIGRYQKMLKQRDAILEDAENKAAGILSDAQEQYKAMIEEHHIMQEAYNQADATVADAQAQAEQIIENAKAQAREIGNGALYYTNDLLDMAQKQISAAYENTVKNSQALEAALVNHLETIRQNQQELMPQSSPLQESGQEPEEQYDENDQQYDEER